MLKSGLSRRLLVTSALLSPTVVLAACNGMTLSQVAAQTASDVALVAQGLVSGLTTLSSVVGAVVPNGGTFTSFVSSVSSYVGQIQAFAAQVAAGMSQAVAGPIVSQINSLFTSIENAMTGVSGLPAEFLKIVGYVSQLMPIIEAAVGVIAPIALTAATVDPDQVRAGLRNAIVEVHAS